MFWQGIIPGQDRVCGPACPVGVFVGDIVVIGAGLAGLRLARLLGRGRRRLEGRQVLFIDAKATFDYLPVLPDVAGGRFDRRHATTDLARYLERLGVNFTRGEVDRVDTQAKEIHLSDGRIIGYAYLVIACGSVTDLGGLAEGGKKVLTLDTAEGAAALFDAVKAQPQKNFVVVGGGYTGVETASNLAVYLRRRRVKKAAVIIVEQADEILSALPEWMQDYCRVNLSRLKVVMYPGSSVVEAGAGRVKLSNGITVNDAVLIWAAGVRTPAFVSTLPYKKDGPGRLVVDAGMRCAEDCFAVGDAASFGRKGRPLRMAVPFAIAQADVAAANVVRACLGRKRSRAFCPLDKGYLVPMANRQACGKVAGLRVWGRPAWTLHYLMCLAYGVSWRMRLGMLRDLLTDNALLSRW